MVNIRKPSTLPKQDCSICTSTIPACTFTSLKFTVVSVNYIHIESQNQNPMIIRVRVLLRVSSLTLFSYFAEARFIQRQGKVWHLYIYMLECTKYVKFISSLWSIKTSIISNGIATIRTLEAYEYIENENISKYRRAGLQEEPTNNIYFDKMRTKISQCEIECHRVAFKHAFHLHINMQMNCIKKIEFCGIIIFL